MALILCIEAGTDVGSVALAKNGELLSLLENLEGRQHAQNLAVYVQEVLQEHDLDAGDLDAVAVGKGPGSYTGLRIAVSLAKGICYGAGIPLIAVNSLEALVHVALEDFDAGILGVDDMRNMKLLPMIDARRMEVYAAVYDRALNVVRDISADIVDENSYLDILNEHPVYFFGNGAAKCREKITHPNAHFIDDIHPLAKMMFPLADKAMAKQDYKDVAYFEPFYLKEFVASLPKKLL